MQNGLFFTQGLNLDYFYNPQTINIFSDASILKRKKSFLGCYGSVAVTGDNILEKKYRLVSNTTVNNSEIKGIRASIIFAIKYANMFDRINIFSDSEISVFGIRDYIYRWKFKNGQLYTSAGKPASNQEIFIECAQLLNHPNLYSKVSIFHQNGHIDNSYSKLQKAAKTFSQSNNIVGKIDLNLIRYISTYNNLVDKESRSFLIRSDKSIQYEDPISFFAKERIRKVI